MYRYNHTFSPHLEYCTQKTSHLDIFINVYFFYIPVQVCMSVFLCIFLHLFIFFSVIARAVCCDRCSACPLSLQPRWNFTGETNKQKQHLKKKRLKKKNQCRRTLSRKLWEVPRQAKVKLTGREKQQDSSERCVSGCGATWVSTILSLDFSQRGSQGLSSGCAACWAPSGEA